MYVQDLRLAERPAVPIVQSPAAGATATQTGREFPDPRLIWGERRATTGRPARGFTDGDRALVHAVTGEDVETVAASDLSAFAFQILTDRHNGRLPASREIDLDYLARTRRRLADLGAANPFSGDQLTAAVRYVQSRQAGRVDVVL